MAWLRSGPALRTVIVGARGGIGSALAEQLSALDHNVWALSRRPVENTRLISGLAIDVEDESSIEQAALAVGDDVDLVIVAVGRLSDGDALRPEKTWRQIDGDNMARLFRVNTIGPALCAKHFLPKLTRKRRAVFAALSARVGSIADNGLGGWHSYRASKAALNMLLKTCSIELRIRNSQAVCLGLHPGTVDTELSRPFKGNVPGDKLFTPADAAGRLLDVIEHATPAQTGQVLDYAGKQIPY